MRRRRVTLSVAILGAALLAGLPALRAAVSYDREVRPLVSDRCFRCHGPDANARQADLRFDKLAELPEGVIVPGQPDESELVRRIFSEDDEERMPPVDSHLALSTSEKETLKQWIAEGAHVTEHWSFAPLPDSVPLPTPKDSSWSRQPLDDFVLTRLETESLTPSPQAAPLRLLRRMSLDLTGLPPTLDEIKQFEAAASRDLESALAAAADRLLASPAYGEQMAVPWLDAVRFADSYGYQSDELSSQWPYRDWVVRAFNSNLSFNLFLTYQIAGDLLERPTRDQVLATAFNRLHRMTAEGGSIPEEWLLENAVDRTNTFGTAILGLTVECARCHDHKYDPISSRDYYSILAFFNSIDENGLYDDSRKVPSPTVMLPTKEQEQRLAKLRAEIAEVEKGAAAETPEATARFERWLADGMPGEALRDLVGHFDFEGDLNNLPNLAADKPAAAHGEGLVSCDGVKGRGVQFDGDHGLVLPEVISIDRPQPFTCDFWVKEATRHEGSVALLQQCFGTDVGFNGFDAVLEDGSLQARLYRIWPGNALGIRAEHVVSQGEWTHVAIAYDGSSRASGLRIYINGRGAKTTVVRDRIRKSAAVRCYGDGQFTVGARFRDRGFRDGQVDELRIFSRDLSLLEILQLHRPEESLLAEPSPGDPSRLPLLKQYYFSAIDDVARKGREHLKDLRAQLVAAEEEVQETAVMAELPTPRPSHILARGAYDAPRTAANLVGRDTFSDFLTPFPADAPRNRRGLAEWVTRPNHPLTARVFVNRLWANFFGAGLVDTPENFGRQGSAPSNPELLDWLARDFVDHGWDVKRLCRQIVLSATYLQDSKVRPELADRDPQNQLLSRGPSFRLSAEQVRDLALAASGLLDRTLGGPPVSPYQPGGDLWREANSMSPPYQQSAGAGLHRRSIYSVWKRTAPLPNMTAFDAGSREVCIVKRSRTNTPLQALVLLNDVQFIEASRALAASVSRDQADPGGQLTEAFLRLTGRRPTAKEFDLLLQIQREQLNQFVAAPADAEKYLAIGEARPDAAIDKPHLAALAVACQAILNLDATIVRR